MAKQGMLIEVVSQVLQVVTQTLYNQEIDLLKHTVK